MDENQSNFITQKISGKTGILILKQKLMNQNYLLLTLSFLRMTFIYACAGVASTYFIKVDKVSVKNY